MNGPLITLHHQQQMRNNRANSLLAKNATSFNYITSSTTNEIIVPIRSHAKRKHQQHIKYDKTSWETRNLDIWAGARHFWVHNSITRVFLDMRSGQDERKTLVLSFYAVSSQK